MQVKVGKKTYIRIEDNDPFMKEWKDALDASPRKDMVMQMKIGFIWVDPYVSVTKVVRVRKAAPTELLAGGNDIIVELSFKKFERLSNIERQFHLSCVCEKIDFTVDKEGVQKVKLRKPDRAYYSQLEEQFGSSVREAICEQNFKYHSGEKENAYNVEF